MISLGIFAKTFSRPTLGAILDEIASLDLASIQFNFSCVGLPTLPDFIDPHVVELIQSEIESRSLQVAAISGTFNLIDPDLENRDNNLQRLGVLASVCEPLRTSIITLSTGTRDSENMWRAHPDNSTPGAWKDMVEGIRLALWVTEPFGITLAVEPEPGNVMSDMQKARRLLDEIDSPRLKILFDAANILASKPDLPQATTLNEAFQLAGPAIALAHGKELVRTEILEKIPGRGELDWALYLAFLANSPYQGPLILHGFDEAHARESVSFVKATLERQSPVR
jgi:sugar phosphate isomerase/epimerase